MVEASGKTDSAGRVAGATDKAVVVVPAAEAEVVTDCVWGAGTGWHAD